MEPKFTVGDLRRAIEAFDPETELHFDGGLTFSKVKGYVDDDEIVILFSELQAELKPETRNQIKVAFGHLEEMDGVVKITSVPRI